MTISSPPPTEFASICNAAVEHALTGAPIPKALPKLMHWLGTDGWDEVLGEWDARNDPMAVKLHSESQRDFRDSEVRARAGLDSTDAVTDEMRVEFARHRIADWTSGEDGVVCPSVHCYNIHHEDGRSAVVGFTVEIHGQAGPVVDLQGVYADESIFLQNLRDSGYYLVNEIVQVSDATILKLWVDKKPKKPTPPSRRSK